MKISMRLLLSICILCSLCFFTYSAQEQPFSLSFDSYNYTDEGIEITYSIFVAGDREIDFNSYVIFDKDNLEISYDKFTCSDVCIRTQIIKRTFIGKHTLEITGKVDRDYYRVEDSFQVKSKEINDYTISLPKKVFLDSTSTSAILVGDIFTNKADVFELELVPFSALDLRESYSIYCKQECNFQVQLTQALILGKYYVNVYSSLGEKQYFFELVYDDKKKQDNDFIVDDSEKNTSLEFVREGKLEKEKKKTDTTVFFNSSLKDVKLSTSLKKVTKVNLNGDEEEILLKKNEEISLDSTTLALVDEENTLRIKNSFLLESKELNESFTKDEIVVFTKNSPSRDNPKPGVYLVEHENGSSELFAYGLVSLNTQKSLYQQNDIVKVIIVVLDPEGYLYSSANISLEVTSPSNETFILSSDLRSVIESKQHGVYFAYFNASEVGTYDFYVQTKVYDIELFRTSYVSIVPTLSYEIIRDVPATIDPWLGPFTNEFSLNLGDLSTSNFEERVPSSFDIVESNAQEIESQGEYTFLRWFNITSSFTPFYSAQTPLITPYLYSLGKAKLFLDSLDFLFVENRSWMFAIDPIVLSDTTFTCSDFWGQDCSLWPASAEPDNTFDTCANSRGNAGDEYVDEVTVSSEYAYPGSEVNVTCSFQPWGTGNEEYIYYYDGASWIQLYSGNAPSSSFHEVTVSTTIGSNLGTHYFRCIIDWNGENDQCANSGSNYDNDDVGITVRSPFLTLHSPQNTQYVSAAVLINISTTVSSNISYKIDASPWVQACSMCTSFDDYIVLTKGNHSIEVVAIDLATGDQDIWVENFEVLNDFVNPPIDTSGRTCTDTFGFDCSLWPAASEGDNTFDTCPSSIGGAGDENVLEAEVSQSSIYIGNSLNATCYFDPFSTGTEEYIYYHDGVSWTQLYSGNAPDGNVHNVTVEVPITANPGTHHVRCIVDWDGENDNCADGGSYYDNDDVSFIVYEEQVVPFELIVLEPQELEYTNPTLTYTFRTSKNATIRYSLDSNPFVTACTTCTNYSNTFLFRNGNYSLNVTAIDDDTLETISTVIFFSVNFTQGDTTINTSGRTCTDTFGEDCSLWPAASESDNTFDSCPTSVGGDNDEHVDEVEVNMSSVEGGTFVDVTCFVDPFNANTEQYLYYYDTQSWTQIFAGNAPNGNAYSFTESVQVSNLSGTHYFRCIVDWDGENDNCADSGQYYDNDDVSLNVFVPVAIPFILSINDPQNATYNESIVPVDILTSKNANISYSLNGGSLIDVCSNCSSYTSTLNAIPGSNFLYVEAIDVETLEFKNSTLFFTYTPEVISQETNTSLIKYEKFISRLDSNLFQVDFRISNQNNASTPLNKSLIVFSYYSDFSTVLNLSYTDSTYYSVTESFENVIINNISTLMYRHKLLPSVSNSTLSANFGTLNQTNSFYLSAVLEMNGNYSFNDLGYASFVLE